MLHKSQVKFVWDGVPDGTKCEESCLVQINSRQPREFLSNNLGEGLRAGRGCGV